MPAIAERSRTYDPDPAHSEQVAVLALGLFDGLRVLHGYGPGERRLLEIAGRLHDIGWSQVQRGGGKHHKLSGELIQKLDIPGLAKKDRISCALIARYHTKAMPDATRHKLFASLNNRRREVVEWLAGMLRVADGLDCGHTGSIRGLTCAVAPEVVCIRLRADNGGCRAAVARALRKQDLLRKKMKRKVEYLC